MRKIIVAIAATTLLVPVLAGQKPLHSSKAASATTLARGKYLVEQVGKDAEAIVVYLKSLAPGK